MTFPTISAFSGELATAIAQASPAVVGLQSGRHSASGLYWQPGVVITTVDAVRRRDQVELITETGTATAKVQGKDPGTDIAVLRVDQLNLPAVELGDLSLLKAGHLAIALMVDSLDETVPVAQFLQAGVRGLLPEDLSADELVLALEAIAGGLTVLHPAVLEDWLQTTPTGPLSELAVPLTPREMEVLQRLATGLANKAIARQLAISEHTVKFHVSSIFLKLNASSRTEAVTVAMRQGLIFM